MEDKHTINLILISFKWVIFSFRVCSWGINSSSKCFHFFSYPEFKFPRPFRRNLHLNHRKALIYFFHPSILSRHSFVTGVLHGGSSWFNSFFKSSSRILLVEFKYLFLLMSRSAINSPYSSEVEFCIFFVFLNFSDIWLWYNFTSSFEMFLISPQQAYSFVVDFLNNSVQSFLPVLSFH